MSDAFEAMQKMVAENQDSQILIAEQKAIKKLQKECDAENRLLVKQKVLQVKFACDQQESLSTLEMRIALIKIDELFHRLTDRRNALEKK